MPRLRVIKPSKTVDFQGFWCESFKPAKNPKETSIGKRCFMFSRLKHKPCTWTAGYVGAEVSHGGCIPEIRVAEGGILTRINGGRSRCLLNVSSHLEKKEHT